MTGWLLSKMASKPCALQRAFVPAATLAVTLLCAPPPAQAGETVYRVVGPGGEVSYTDTPPEQGEFEALELDAVNTQPALEPDFEAGTPEESPTVPYERVAIVAPAGFLKSSIRDMSRFTQAAMLARRTGGAKVPKPIRDAFRLAQTPFACEAGPPALQNCPSGRAQAGLGWQVFPRDGGKPRVLVPGGRVAVIEFDGRKGLFVRWFGHYTERGAVLEEMAAAGYRVAEDHDFLDRQSFLVFTPEE